MKFCLRVIILSVIIGSLSAPDLQVFGQGELIIKGKVIDRKSTEAIPFASVRLITRKGVYGVVSNAEGDFQIPSKYRAISDTIQVSCIGYLTRKILLHELSDNNLNLVRLEGAARQLQEVIVKGKKTRRPTAEEIVRTAIKNIRINYPVDANSYIAYYRDYQIKEDNYINLNEAVVEVIDEGFNSDDREATDLDLLEYKKNEEFQRDSTTDIQYDNNQGNKFIPGAILSPFGGNELSILRMHDAIRNNHMFSYSFVNELDAAFVSNHRFQFGEMVYLNNVPLYNIMFYSRPEATGTRHYAKGHIYIEKGNFAIHQLEYNTFEREDSNAKLLYTIRVEYSRYNSLMRLNYISFNNLFKIRDPLDFKTEDILFDWDAMAFIITFNHIPETKSLSDFKNYDFTFDKKKIKVIDVKSFNDREREKEVHVFVELKTPYVKKEEFLKRLSVEVKGITDTDGREVNVVHHIPVNQFRELFVQTQTARNNVAGDSLHLRKDVPLSKNKIRRSADMDVSAYWMNTPLKKE